MKDMDKLKLALYCLKRKSMGERVINRTDIEKVTGNTGHLMSFFGFEQQRNAYTLTSEAMGKVINHIMNQDLTMCEKIYKDIK